MKTNLLYDSFENCCGCEACVNICPKNAIEMEEEYLGFKYPKIDTSKCVDCKLCLTVCGYKKENDCFTYSKKVYAGARIDNEKIKKSSSGGIFAIIAEEFIKNGGFVVGAAFNIKNSTSLVKHEIVFSEEKLHSLYGSKYVKSDMSGIYNDVKSLLQEGKKVLFSGTPCQISSIKAYLGKNYENLYTLDLVCHGTPSGSLFINYIRYVEMKRNINIKSFNFRDKKYGWGLKGSFTYTDQNDIEYTKVFDTRESSYYTMFLDAVLYQECCYSCKFASDNRIGDITIGDYWGIEKVHPDYIDENGGTLSKKQGISVFIINSKKGEMLFNCIKKDIKFYPSTYVNAARYNGQLHKPSSRGKFSKIVRLLYLNNNYLYIHYFYSAIIFKRKLSRSIKKLIKH